MGLVLTSKYHVPDSSLEYVLNTYKSLLHENAVLQSDYLRRELSALGLSDPAETERIIESVVYDSALSKLLGPNGPMRSSYIRQQSYGKWESAKIEELGLGTLSDLKYVLDVEQCFLDVLKPVGVGKLKEFIEGMLFLQLNCVYGN